MSLDRRRRPHALPAVLDEMDRAFDRFFRWPLLRTLEGEEFDFGPAVDVYETDTELVVRAELPGVKKEDIDLTVEDDRLLLTGSNRQEQEVNEEGYHRKEMRSGVFRRVVSLPAAVKADEMTATFENGVLTIRAPKVEEEIKGTKVEIS